MAEAIQPHILIVDDDAPIGTLLTEYLTENGLRVSVVDVQMLRLRRRIEADPAQPTYIVTERGVGYSFKSAVEKVY